MGNERISNGMTKRTKKSQIIEEKIDKLPFINIKSFCSSKTLRK